MMDGLLCIYWDVVAIGISNSDRCKYVGFDPLHLVSSGIRFVIKPEEMENSVDHQVGEVVTWCNPLLSGFGRDSLSRNDNVAQKHRRARLIGRLNGGKRQHICWFIQAAESLIELANFVIIAQRDSRTTRLL